MKVKHLLYCVLLLFACNVNAQDIVEEKADDIGIISELVEVSFIPARATLLVVNQDEKIEKYRAEFVSVESLAESQRIYVGGRISINRKELIDNALLVTFIFEGNNSEMAATPVKSWKIDSIKRNSKSIEQLSEGSEIIKEKIVAAQAQMAQLDRRSKDLRDIVSQIAGVEEIVKLKSELEAIEARVIDLKVDKKRLQSLTATAKRRPEVDDIDILRRELNVHLTEAAKATALADRLTKRKQKAALQDIQEKMAAIKETAHEDPKALARLALELRAERKKLEIHLGEKNVGSAEQDEF